MSIYDPTCDCDYCEGIRAGRAMSEADAHNEQHNNSDNGELPPPPYAGRPASETLGELGDGGVEDFAPAETFGVGWTPEAGDARDLTGDFHIPKAAPQTPHAAAVKILRSAITDCARMLTMHRGELTSAEHKAAIASAAIAEKSRELDELRATLAQLEAAT